MRRLEGKTALITGIGGGMGRDAAIRFAQEGARVVGCDLFDDGAAETARMVRESGGQIEYKAPVDLSDAKAARDWIEWGIEVFGGADILYNNASSPKFGDVQDLSIEDWDYVINNELNLVFYTVKAIWPYFMKHGGVVLNVGSIAGTRGVEFMSQNAHGTAKGGVISLTQQLAAEGGKYGIRSVCVSPGFTVTPSTEWLVETGPEPFRKNIARIPLGRVGRPEDIVNAAVFLASDEASWITGINLVVDGGGSGTRMTMQLDIPRTGSIYYPGDDGFETARVGRVFNGRRPDRQPAAVLVAQTEDDVVYGVRLAKMNGWSVAVRSGGHSWAAWSVQSGTLLIDLGELQGMGYDEATGIAWANPAVKGGDTLSPWLETQGRFFNGGHCPSVGIGGFLLQGGQGWCQRGWGWAAESVAAVDVVTADGEKVHANEQENPDLYWAARGAGPSFPGIVTRFYLRTRPMFGFLGHTVQVYDLADFDEVMQWMYGVHQTISPDVEIVVVSTTLPTEPGQKPVRRLLVTGVAMTDTQEQAREALAPFNTCPVLDRARAILDCRPSSLAEQRQEQERQNPEHARYRVDSLWAEGEPGKVIEHIKPMFTELPTPGSFTIWFSNGPVRQLPDMAFSLQTEAYVASYIVYDDAEQDEQYRDDLNRLTTYAEPVTAGQYLGDSDMTNRQVKFMADENFARLQKIIARRDPDGRFVRYLAQDTKTINQNHWEL